MLNTGSAVLCIEIHRDEIADVLNQINQLIESGRISGKSIWSLDESYIMNVAAVQQVVGIGRTILIEPYRYSVGEIVRIFFQVIERFLRHDALIHVINGHIGGHTGSFVKRLNGHFLAVQCGNHVCLFIHLYPEDLTRLLIASLMRLVFSSFWFKAAKSCFVLAVAKSTTLSINLPPLLNLHNEYRHQRDEFQSTFL